MTALNPNCNCPRTDCPRHGNCMECVENHKKNSSKIPYCLRFMVEIEKERCRGDAIEDPALAGPGPESFQILFKRRRTPSGMSSLPE